MSPPPAIAESRRSRLFVSLCSMVFLVNLARIVFAPMVEVFKTEFMLSTGEAGLIATLVWVGSAAPRLPAGYLLTRMRRHQVILGTGVLLTVAAAFTATSTSSVMLYVGVLAMGLSSGVYFISANPLVSELYPERVGRAIGIHGTSSQLAAVIAPTFVTVTLLVADWRLTFWLISGVSAVATAVLFLIARRATLPEAGATDRHLLVAFRAQWPLVLSAVAIIGATGFVWNGVFNLYVTYLIETKDFAEPVARNLLTVMFAAGVPAFFLTGRLADRFSHVPLMLAILGSFVVCLVSLTMVSGLAAVVVVSGVTGYVVHSLFPAIDTYTLSSLPDEHRGSAYATYSALAMLSQAGGSAVLGTFNDLGYGFDLLFRGSAVALFVVLLALTALYVSDRLPTGGRPA